MLNYENQLSNINGLLKLFETPLNIARIIHHKYENSFLCIERQWYCYDKHHWKKLESTAPIRSKISKDALDEYGVVLMKIKLEIKKLNESPGIEREAINRTIKLIENKDKKIVRQLHESRFKNNVIQKLSEMFGESEEKIKQFDDNKALIGFSNGVFDLDKLEFRDGCPEDLITLSTGYDYESNPNMIIQDELNYVIYEIDC